jgi:hypothetical protein
MVNKKDLIIAVLTTFCLTATIFMVIPIRSSTNPYDPWIDYDDDGKIGLSDLVSLANSYGTTGDPTKNVNVTNWPTVPSELDYKVINLGVLNCTGNGGTSVTATCGGYSRLSFFMWGVEMKDVGTPYSITVKVDSWWWSIYEPGSTSAASVVEYPTYEITFTSTPYPAWFTPLPLLLETKAPSFSVVLQTNTTYPSPVWATFELFVYLRNE